VPGIPITTREMRVLEVNAVGLGIPLRLLMEVAGASVAKAVESRVQPDEAGEVVILAGKGGNGGDALVASRFLAGRGYSVTVVPAYSFELVEHPDTRANIDILMKLSTVRVCKPADIRPIRGAGVVIDGLLGTGVRGELRDPLKTIVEEANKSRAKLKVAVDTPTGLNPDTGEVHGVAFKADITVTFHDVKPGLLKRPDLTGEVIVSNIGIPEEAWLYVGPGDVIHRLPKKPSDAYKGIGGRILVVGGSERFTGAPAFVGTAAIAAGADLAFIAVPEAVRDIVASYNPELITIALPGKHFNPEHINEVTKLAKELRVHAVAVGPGLGRERDTLEFAHELILKLVEEGVHVVVDADALRSIKFGADRLGWRAVLTPHRGEFKAMTGAELEGCPSTDAGKVVEASSKLEAAILLKAPVDIIAFKGKYRLNRTGNPGMSVGGTGDVLTGIVAAALAKTEDPFTAASVGAYLNGLAGDYLSKVLQDLPTPTKLIDVLPAIINNPLRTHLRTYLGIEEE